jgi:hypothetical protein
MLAASLKLKKNLNYISQLGTIPITPFSSEDFSNIWHLLFVLGLFMTGLKFCVDITSTTEHNDVFSVNRYPSENSFGFMSENNRSHKHAPFCS